MGIKKIELGEDNGFLFGGVPTLIVVTVYFLDGRSVRFPYTAEKTISALYEDMIRVVPETKLTPPSLTPNADSIFGSTEVKSVEYDVVKSSNPNEIEKEDIVTLIKLEDRGAGATVDLRIGGRYRVIRVGGAEIPGHGRVVDSYDVIDDNASVPSRMFVFAHEVVLFKKHPPFEKKKLFLEEGITCPKCNNLVYCGLHDGFYVGKCDCGQEISVSREELKGGQAVNRSIEAPQTAGVGSDIPPTI